jgi:DNA-binding XRE family transcriptional regulator
LVTGQGSRPANLTPALCRAARGLLDWTQSDLAAHAYVSRSTIRDFEGNRHEIHRATEAQLCRAFEDHDVVFVALEDCGQGVCLRRRPDVS